MSEVNTRYSSYVHTGNSGFTIGVEVEKVADDYSVQYLTTSLHAFGLPHETKMWLDDNVIDALEYILAKAKEQRAAIPELQNRTWKVTEKAVPPHVREPVYTGECSTDSPGEQAVS
ncbi:predicted ORF [Xanthomonas phage XacN1]|nr:predicted ORF [Xanthomonas phage XacN1]